MTDNPLWLHILQSWESDPVQQELLRLQNQCGCDVLVLLTCDWLAHEWASETRLAGRMADKIAAKLLAASEVFQPRLTKSRQIRQQLRPASNQPGSPARRLRRALLRAEGVLERHEVGALFAALTQFPGSPSISSAAPRPAVARCFHNGRTIWRRALLLRCYPAVSTDHLQHLLQRHRPTGTRYCGDSGQEDTF